MRDYRTALEHLAARLRADPAVQVHAWHLGPPLTAAAVAALEAASGQQLDATLRHLYQQLNGAELRWALRPELPAAARQAWYAAHPGREAENGELPAASASIRLLPLAEVLHGTWAAWVGEEPYYDPADGLHGKALTAAEFARQVRPFDCFSHYRAAALRLRPHQPPYVFLLTDDCGSFNDSCRTDVASYLDHVLAMAGGSDARQQWLGRYHGYARVAAWPPPAGGMAPTP